MTTQAYYKERLGFDPNDPKEMTSLDPKLHGYEENLTKFKGSFVAHLFFLLILYLR